MSKSHSLAQRIAETKRKLAAQSDELGKRLDELDQKSPQAFARAQSIIDEQHADIDSMEQELRQLSNS